MSNKKSDKQIIARRLRPIYDALDGGQYKKAVLEADKVLKKHPNTLTAKALKALAFIRIDRASDALPILKTLEVDVINEDFDDNTVQALCHCYKELNNPERIVTLYSALSKQHPSNEQIMRELFYSLIRTKNFQLGQKIAIQLYKNTNQIYFYCCAVMCVLMQGFNNKSLGRSMYFPLAEKMLEKLQISDLLQLDRGLDLRLLVFEACDKYPEAIELIESNQRFFADTHSDEQLRLRLDSMYKKCGNKNAVHARAICGIENDPDEWSNWVNLAESTVSIIKSTKTDEHCLRVVTQVIDLWRNIFDVCCSGFCQMGAEHRGLLLARLYFIQEFYSLPVLSAQKLVNTHLGTTLSAFKALVRVVHNKPFAFADLKMFLHLLKLEEEQAELLNYISVLISQDTNNTEFFKKSPTSIWSIILSEQLRYEFNPPATLTDEQLRNTVQRLITEMFELSEASTINNGDEKGFDAVCVAPFIQLIVYYTWEFYTRNEQYGTLLSLAALIEWVYSYFNGCTASLPIILCRLYGIFGDLKRIQSLEKQIQLKFIQRDSLAFLRFFIPYQFGKYRSANIYFTSLGAMYDNNEREINECFVHAYRNQSFNQLPKLLTFAEQCANSIFSVGVDVMNRLVSGCFAVTADLTICTLVGGGEIEKIDWNAEMSDNRDFSVLPSICSEQYISKIQTESYKEMKFYLKLMHKLSNAIGYIGTEKLHEKAKEFFATLETCKTEFYEANSLERLFDSYINLQLHSLINGRLMDLPLLIIRLATDLTETLKSGKVTTEFLQEKFPTSEEFSTHLDEFHNFYNKCNANELGGRIEFLKEFSRVLIIVAISLLGCNYLENFVQASLQQTMDRNEASDNINKKSVKDTQQQIDNKRKIMRIEPLKSYVHHIHQHLQKMQAFLSNNFKNIEPIEVVDDPFGINELLPEKFQRSVLEQQKRVLNSINIAHRIEELDDAIAHLLLNHCSLGINNLNIKK